MSLCSRVLSRFNAISSAREKRRAKVSVEEVEHRQLLNGSLPRPDHVVVLIEENHAADEILGNPAAPYINSLANGPHTAVFSHSVAITHPSQPNYVALFSGSTQGVPGDGLPKNLPFRTPNLGAELLASGQAFVGYSETLLHTGYTGQWAGYYARKHNPWVNWQDSPVNGIPAADNQPFTSFPTDYSKLPTVSFVVPNLMHDMHNGTVAQADTWLKQSLGGYITWAQTHNSLLILTFDEDDHSQSNHIATLFVGPMVKGGVATEPISHLNVLRTIEDMYNLPYAGASGKAAAIREVWTSSTPQTSTGAPGPSGDTTQSVNGRRLGTKIAKKAAAQHNRAQHVDLLQRKKNHV
jgi:acid phosphatase